MYFSNPLMGPPHLWNMPISIRVKSKNVCDNLDLELLPLNGLGDLRMVENLEFWTEKLSEEVDILFSWGKTFVFDSNSEVSVEPALSRSKNLKIRTWIKLKRSRVFFYNSHRVKSSFLSLELSFKSLLQGRQTSKRRFYTLWQFITKGVNF